MNGHALQWRRTRIGEVFEFTQKPRSVRYGEHETVPFVPMEYVPIGHPYFKRYDLRPSKATGSGTYFESGDLLVAKITPSFENGKQGIIAELPAPFGIATTEVIPVRGVSGVSDTLFLAFFLLGLEVRTDLANKMEGTTGRQRLGKSTLAAYQINLPPLKEQQTIAAALLSIQDAQLARRRELALERERKAALMHHLFTRGTRGGPTKLTEIGEMPEGWEVEPLGKFIVHGPQNGLYKHESAYGCGTPIVRINDFDNDGAFITTVFQRVQLNQVERERYRLSKDDLLINRVNSLSHLGKCALIPAIPEASVFESNMMRLRVNGNVLRPGFLLRFLSLPETRDRMRRMAKLAVAQASINQGDIKSLLVPIPPFEQQRTIEKALDVQDLMHRAMSHEVAVIEELFQALLADLLTGVLRP